MNIDVVLAGRVAERLLVCFFGGLSVVLGWSLFKAGVSLEQAAEFKAGPLAAKVQRAAPGTFFALFGCAILIHSATKPLQYDTRQSVSNTAESKNSAAAPVQGNPPAANTTTRSDSQLIYYGGSSVDRRRIAQAINTIKQLASPPGITALQPAQRKALATAEGELVTLRNQYVMAEFGLDAVRTFERNMHRKLSGDLSLSASEREQLQRLEPWMEDTLELAGESR